MLGSDPVTGKMPVPQVLLLKWKHYIYLMANKKIVFSQKTRSRNTKD